VLKLGLIAELEFDPVSRAMLLQKPEPAPIHEMVKAGRETKAKI